MDADVGHANNKAAQRRCRRRARDGSLDVARLLIEEGAEFVGQADNDGATPLHGGVARTATTTSRGC